MGKLVTLIKLLLSLSFVFGGWIATLEYRHRHTETVSSQNVEEIRSFSLWKERTEASRFDSKQGNELYQNITNRANVQDLRVQKLESNQEAIKESLKRIEAKLGTN